MKEDKQDYGDLALKKSSETKAEVVVHTMVTTKPEISLSDSIATQITSIPNEFYPSDHYSLAYIIEIK